MIDITMLDESDKGIGVVYVSRHGAREDGTISSWSKDYVFVRFRNGAVNACHPSDLEWLCGKDDARKDACRGD